MRKILLIIAFILNLNICYAGTLSYSTTYGVNSSVTAANLNGNFNDAKNIINGQLDNTNANTASGFRFYETLSTLPITSLTQGRTVFLTSDNSWNVYTGSLWVKMGSQTNYAYGTSTSAYTSIDYTSMKITYGTATSVAANSSQAITNLPFTSATSYICTVIPETTNVATGAGPSYKRNSASQMTVYNADNGITLDLAWHCIGT